jgi:hypothetical protein
MSLIQFVKNHEDLSTDRGYQFKFYCDKCGNGHMSTFDPSVIGTAGSLLRAAGSIFGGWASSAGYSAYEVQRAVGGKAHDAALSKAVQEAKLLFHQCTRCGKWVCPDVCWNGRANICEDCAPNFQEEMASSQAHAKADAARQQMYTAAQNVNYVSGVDMSADSVLGAQPAPTSAPARFCGNCGASVGAAKFCPECGTPAGQPKPKCAKCGFEAPPNTRFCPECGGKL